VLVLQLDRPHLNRRPADLRIVDEDADLEEADGFAGSESACASRRVVAIKELGGLDTQRPVYRCLDLKAISRRLPDLH
jgi:hypothetical protein